MIDQIATWTNRHGIDFAEFAAMVSVWSSDPEYWANQAMPRLYAEAVGSTGPMAKPAPFRI